VIGPAFDRVGQAPRAQPSGPRAGRPRGQRPSLRGEHPVRSRALPSADAVTRFSCSTRAIRGFAKAKSWCRLATFRRLLQRNSNPRPRLQLPQRRPGHPQRGYNAQSRPPVRPTDPAPHNKLNASAIPASSTNSSRGNDRERVPFDEVSRVLNDRVRVLRSPGRRPRRSRVTCD